MTATSKNLGFFSLGLIAGVLLFKALISIDARETDVSSTASIPQPVLPRTTESEIPDVEVESADSPGTGLGNVLPLLSDPQKLTISLADAGFPPEIIRLILEHVVTAKIYAENSDLFPRRSETWWKNTPRPRDNDSRLFEISGQIRRELHELSKLIPPGPPSEAERDNLKYRYGDISALKISQIRAIEIDYDEILFTSLAELPQNEQTAAHRTIELGRRSDLKSLLSPDEYDQYMARTSPTVQVIKTQLSGMELSEQEFLQLAAVYVPHEEATMLAEHSFAEERAAQGNLRIAQFGLQSQMGDERYYTYLEQMDPDFGQIHKFVGSENFSPNIERQIWQVKSQYDIRLSTAIASQASASQIIKIRNEAISMLSASVGVEPTAKIINTHGSSWFPLPPTGG